MSLASWLAKWRLKATAALALGWRGLTAAWQPAVNGVAGNV